MHLHKRISGDYPDIKQRKKAALGCRSYRLYFLDVAVGSVWTRECTLIFRTSCLHKKYICTGLNA